MTRSRIVALAILVAASALSFEVGFGATQIVDNNTLPAQIGTCPANFKLTPVLAGNPVDRNGNGYICWYIRPGSETPVQIDDRI